MPSILRAGAHGHDASILGKGPYLNEAQEVAESTMTCIMGREAAYSGQKITWDTIMNSKQDLMPKNFDTRPVSR